jgi:hypothetical protein
MHLCSEKDIFGTKGGKVTGEWKRLHNEEVHCLLTRYIPVIKLRKLRLTGHVVRTGERRYARKFFWVKPEGRRQSERPRHRYDENIKIYLQEQGWRLILV